MNYMFFFHCLKLLQPAPTLRIGANFILKAAEPRNICSNINRSKCRCRAPKPSILWVNNVTVRCTLTNCIIFYYKCYRCSAPVIKYLL